MASKQLFTDNLELKQQDAIESLKQNGCSVNEIKGAISIFERSKGHGQFCGTDLMKIILDKRDKEDDNNSDGENGSSAGHTTSKKDKERCDPNNMQKYDDCYKSTRHSFSTTMCSGCKRFFVAKWEKYATM